VTRESTSGQAGALPESSAPFAGAPICQPVAGAIPCRGLASAVRGM